MRFRPIVLALATLPALGILPAAADDAYRKCLDDGDGTNAAYGRCGAALVEREDERLNAAWKRLFALAEGRTRADLLAEQRLWLKFKEAACAFYANGERGREGQALGYPACRAGVIAERTEALDAYAEALRPQ